MTTDSRQGETQYVSLDVLKAQVDASYTDEERQEYLAAQEDAEIQIQLAELIYKLRTEAGISQTELARRMGSRQPFISALERGARTPTVATLNRIAYATGQRLLLATEPI